MLRSTPSFINKSTISMCPWHAAIINAVSSLLEPTEFKSVPNAICSLTESISPFFAETQILLVGSFTV